MGRRDDEDAALGCHVPASGTCDRAELTRYRPSMARGLALMLAFSLAATLLMAWPVVRAPSVQIFGRELVGRHHDPFTVMWRFENGAPSAPYRQPLVDDVGAALTRAVGPVAAFNAIILFSFPASACAAYALSRYLHTSHAGAIVAGLAFAFAPFRLAHAAYHPHVLQTHWMAVYFLALWACLRRATRVRCLLLACAVAALILSNLYGAFIAAVVTPVAVMVFWTVGAGGADRDQTAGMHRMRDRRVGRLMPTLLTLGATLGAALGLVAAVTPSVLLQPFLFAFDRSDLSRDGAQWWAYLLPPVEHPLLGWVSRAAWARTSSADALLEQQVSVSWALLTLSAVALVAWLRLGRTGARATARQRALVRIVPVCLAVAVWSAFCSLAPAPGESTSPMAVPATWLHGVAPMFRAYARFGVVTHLMVALLAGVAVTILLGSRPTSPVPIRSGAVRPQAVLLTALLGLGAFEYMPLPWRSRDVLPTAAHRFLAGQPASMRVLDCRVAGPGDALLPWLMRRDLRFLSEMVPACDAPDFAARLAALEYSHVIVRTDAMPAGWSSPLSGLEITRAFPDSLVLAVTAEKPALIVLTTSGFYAPDEGTDRRWMGQRGEFAVRNTTGPSIPVVLDVELSSLARERRIAVSFGANRIAIIPVARRTARYRIGPFLLAPGDEQLRFDALEPATVADEIAGNGDQRALTVLMGAPVWQPPVAVMDTPGFFPPETGQGRTWQWMSERGTLAITNPTGVEVRVVATIELAAFAHRRRLAVSFDNRPLGTVLVTPERRPHRIGPLSIETGPHHLEFFALEPPTVPHDLLGSSDHRPLTVVMSDVTWSFASEERRR